MNFEVLSFMLRAQATAEAVDQAELAKGQLVMSVIMMAAIFAMMYFFMIRPQRKKEKEAQEMRDNLQMGDEVVTIGGIVGIIVRKNEETKTVVIETGGDRSKIRVKMWAISENLTIHDTTEEAVKKK